MTGSTFFLWLVLFIVFLIVVWTVMGMGKARDK